MKAECVRGTKAFIHAAGGLLECLRSLYFFFADHLITDLWLNMDPAHCSSNRVAASEQNIACAVRRRRCRCYLLRCAEDVSVVLAEPAHAGQPSQRARQLVPVQGPEVGPPQREFPPRAEPLLEHETEHRREREEIFSPPRKWTVVLWSEQSQNTRNQIIG